MTTEYDIDKIRNVEVIFNNDESLILTKKEDIRTLLHLAQYPNAKFLKLSDCMVNVNNILFIEIGNAKEGV